MIRINYNALSRQAGAPPPITAKLLRRAKRLLGFNARKRLIQVFDHQLRILAVEIAQRQANPQILYDAGSRGLLEALKMYEVGETRQRFVDFALPFIRTHMIHERDKATA